MKWIEIEGKLREGGFRLFTAREFRQVTGSGAVAAKFLLIRYTRRGLLRRLKRGLYALSSRMPSKWGIANRLYKPSYISLVSALSYYGFIPESVYAVTSITTKSTREFEADGTAYAYRTVKSGAFGGYKGVELGEETVLLAEKEKALADYLYFVFLKKERLNSRLSLRGANIRRLEGYLRDFKNKRLMDWYRHDLKIGNREP
jgi:predicted transcriptional regulator of viral defense system